MSKEQEIIEFLRQAVNADAIEIYSGKVKSVDENEASCTVELPNGTENTVRLRSVIDTLDGLVQFPEVGSEIDFAQVDGGSGFVLLRASKLTQVAVKIGNATLTIKNGEIDAKVGDTEHKMTASAHSIKTSNEDLKALLDDLLQAILALTVTTSSGPSGTPINAATFTQIKNRVQNLLA